MAGLCVWLTGMKFVDLNRYECALVLSTNGKVTWAKQKSNRSGLRIEKGMPLHEASLARYLVEPTGRVGPTAVEPDAWITESWTLDVGRWTGTTPF